MITACVFVLLLGFALSIDAVIREELVKKEFPPGKSRVTGRSL